MIVTRAAIYARYSTELQSDRSIEDQVALCDRFIEQRGWRAVASFSDRARSGASTVGRDGLIEMMARARAGDFDVVVVEALDRISRDQEDLAGIYKRLSFLGIEIVGVHDGKADQIQVGIRGLVGALYLEDLKHKVHRGMDGVVRDGRHAGGRAYGYRPKLGHPGELEIVEEEAAIVRRIYEEYRSGMSPRDIATGLNTDRVPAPRGTSWLASTLNGNAARGHGILVNPIYGGRNVWNRVRMIKNPDTGKRVSRVNDPAMWVAVEAADLAIVSSDLFEAVQQRKAARAHLPVPKRRRPKHLFSGLLKCGCCGGGLSVKDRDHGRIRLICTRSREGGVCANRRHFYLDEIEGRVSRGLRQRLGTRAAMDRYLRSYTEERRRLAGDRVGVLEKLDRRLAAIDADLGRATDLLIRGILDEDKGALQIRELKSEKAALTEERHATVDAVPDLAVHPAIADSYLASLDRLEDALKGPEGPMEAEEFSAVRDLLEAITVTPDASSSKSTIEVTGDLARFLAPSGTSSGGSVVAEEGFEPPTHGL
jgi:site-specific DNA recombinase